MHQSKEPMRVARSVYICSSLHPTHTSSQNLSTMHTSSSDRESLERSSWRSFFLTLFAFPVLRLLILATSPTHFLNSWSYCCTLDSRVSCLSRSNSSASTSATTVGGCNGAVLLQSAPSQSFTIFKSLISPPLTLTKLESQVALAGSGGSRVVFIFSIIPSATTLFVARLLFLSKHISTGVSMKATPKYIVFPWRTWSWQTRYIVFRIDRRWKLSSMTIRDGNSCNRFVSSWTATDRLFLQASSSSSSHNDAATLSYSMWADAFLVSHNCRAKELLPDPGSPTSKTTVVAIKALQGIQ